MMVFAVAIGLFFIAVAVSFCRPWRVWVWTVAAGIALTITLWTAVAGPWWAAMLWCVVAGLSAGGAMYWRQRFRSGGV